MNTITHMRLDIAGAIRNKAFNGFTNGKGRDLTRQEAHDQLRLMLHEGHKFMPLGDCEGFDPQTGCPGHAVPDSTVEVEG
jgi:hypothetical protein